MLGCRPACFNVLISFSNAAFPSVQALPEEKKINKGHNYSLVSYVVLYVECKENEEYWEYTASLNTLLQILSLRIQIAMG